IITNWNQAAERIFGYQAKDVIGKPITILIPPDRLDEEPGILNRIRHGERVDHFETVRQHKSGRPLELSLTISPIKNQKGEIVGASKIARDISDRKRNQQQQQALYELITLINRTNDMPEIYGAAVDTVMRCQ